MTGRGGGLRLRAEFPLLLHGYAVEEVFARRFVLVAYRPDPARPGSRPPPVPGRNHRLPHTGLAGASLSVALTKRITLAAGYADGIDAPRGRGFGGHEVDTQLEFEY